MTINWRGVFPAACTQFNSDQSLNIPGTLAHVDAMLAAGIHGLVMMGSVGENTTLDPAEKKELLEATIAHVNKRVPVLTGVAEYTTTGACRWAADAAKLGSDGLMVLPPMVYKTDDRETIAHFRAVARATDLPIMVYNNPPAYKVDITPSMFVDMADEPKFACIKESSDNPRRITNAAPAIYGTDVPNWGQVQSLVKEANRGIAMAMALSSQITPSARGKTTINFGTGFYKGEVGMALNFVHRVNLDTPVYVSGGVASAGNGNFGGRIGLGVEF